MFSFLCFAFFTFWLKIISYHAKNTHFFFSLLPDLVDLFFFSFFDTPHLSSISLFAFSVKG